MSAYGAFIKKEFTEYTRTYKLMILIIIFLLLGFMNPLTAKYLPQLVQDFMPAGISITVAEPTVMDSWQQFFKNVPQMGLIVLVIVFSGLMSNELARGTLTNMLTKGLKRRTVILAKFTAASLVWTVCYYLSAAVTVLYNQLFWKLTRAPHIFAAVNSVWLFGVFLISVLLLGGILFKSTFGGLLFTGGITAVLFFLAMVPPLTKYNPVQLVSANMGLLHQTVKLTDIYPAAAVTGVAAAVVLLVGAKVFNKKQI